LGPNIDFFPIAEIEKLIEKFKETAKSSDDKHFEENKGEPSVKNSYRSNSV
jgi:hypothetical protein